MSLIAVRGAMPLKDEIELQAHLATLLRLENIGLLLGAGASVCAGGKTVREAWDDFVQATPNSAQWLVDHDFVGTDALVPGDARKRPNLEALFDALEIANVEWRRQADPTFVELESARADLYRAIVRAALLREEWWGSPNGAERDVEALQHHRSILQKIVSARQPGQAAPWVFTTNYDLAIEWAAESIDLQVATGFLGLHSRRFSPQSYDIGLRNTQARGEARFGVYNIYLAKLHGSLSWRKEAEQIYEIPAALAYKDLRAFLDDPTIRDLSLLVMPRAAKYMQTVGYVLGELFRRFSEFLSRSQTALLVSGYGFGDEHVNRLLLSALLNPTLQLVIYYPEFMGDVNASSLPKALRKLLSLKNPRVTVVGGEEKAHLDQLAQHLPDPLLYDESMRALEKELKDAWAST